MVVWWFVGVWIILLGPIWIDFDILWIGSSFFVVVCLEVLMFK